MCMSIELDHKEGCVPKNWCFHTVVLEKTLKSTLDSKKIKPISLSAYSLGPQSTTKETDKPLVQCQKDMEAAHQMGWKSFLEEGLKGDESETRENRSGLLTFPTWHQAALRQQPCAGTEGTTLKTFGRWNEVVWLVNDETWGPCQGESGLLRPGGSWECRRRSHPHAGFNWSNRRARDGALEEGGMRNELRKELHGEAWKGWRRKGSSWGQLSGNSQAELRRSTEAARKQWKEHCGYS